MIVFKEFLLNRGISQHANLIILKPSGVTCECESSCRSHTARETFISLLCTHGRLHCLDHTAVDVCTYVWTSVGNDSDKSFCSWGETDLKLLITLVFQSPTLFYRNILAALSANVKPSARNLGVVFDCIIYLKKQEENLQNEVLSLLRPDHEKVIQSSWLYYCYSVYSGQSQKTNLKHLAVTKRSCLACKIKLVLLQPLITVISSFSLFLSFSSILPHRSTETFNPDPDT